METVAQMNKKLSELNQAFSESTTNFMYSINLHQTKFTQLDVNDFENLISKIKKYVNEQITQFFNIKFLKHSQNYEDKITNYTQNSEQLQFQLFGFRNQLERQTTALKQQEQRNQVILEHFSKKFYINSLKKKHLQAFKKNAEQNKKQRYVIDQAEELYRKNLKKKVFFPWRSLTYKDGYQNTIAGQTQVDIQNIHAQYSSIISILKQKIKDTDELIKLKKAAKGQFAYALSKNLMKTISNLSLEVMSLNQMNLSDGQYGKSKEEQKLMNQIDKIIQEKVKKVNQYKENLINGSQMGTQRQSKQRQRKIRFI